MRATRAALIAGASMLLIAAALVEGPRLVRQLTFFHVRQVEVVGARYLDESEIVRRLGVHPGDGIFDRMAPLQAAARAIPGVVAASVERVVPGTLRITVREAVPVAIVPDSGQMRLMDSLGHILPFDPTRVPASLPIAMQDSTLAALLARLLRTDRRLYDAIESARLDRGDIVLDLGARRIRLRPEADAGTLQDVIVVLGYLNSRSVAWREIDARYRGRVFVQKGAA